MTDSSWQDVSGSQWNGASRKDLGFLTKDIVSTHISPIAIFLLVAYNADVIYNAVATSRHRNESILLSEMEEKDKRSWENDAIVEKKNDALALACKF